MSSTNDGQNGQSVGINSTEKRALARIGVNAGDLGLPAVGIVLSDQQAAFVTAYVQNGGNRVEAAETAAYAYPAQAAASLMRMPGIKAAIKREQAFAVAGLVVMADKVLAEILGSSITVDKVKIAAARVAYERGGVLKRAALEAEKEVMTPGALAGMGIDELERVIVEATQREAARRAAEGAIDMVPDADGTFGQVS